MLNDNTCPSCKRQSGIAVGDEVYVGVNVGGGGLVVCDDSVAVAGRGVYSIVATKVAEGAVFARAQAERVKRSANRIDRRIGKRYRFCRGETARISMSILTISVGSHYTLLTSGCSAVGSAPRLGRGGRRFKSAHPDFLKPPSILAGGSPIKGTRQVRPPRPHKPLAKLVGSFPFSGYKTS